MSRYKNYCSNCQRETLHYEWTEDAYGGSGTTRIFTSIISLGMSNLITYTFIKCLSCNKKRCIK
jgi:hypothetical protein